jgi:uncharacterized protein
MSQKEQEENNNPTITEKSTAELTEQIEELKHFDDKDIIDFILDEEYSAKDQTQKLRDEFFNGKFNRLYVIPKLKNLEISIYGIGENLRKHDLDIEKIAYAIKTHEKQILVLERFIEQQNIKNEQIHFEIAKLKITLEAIEKNLIVILSFIEGQGVKNDQVHADIVSLKGSIEIMQTQTTAIVSSIERMGGNFDQHLSDIKAFFFKDAKEATEKTERDMERYKLLIRIGYWIAGTLGALSFLILSIYSVLTDRSLPSFLLEVFKMLPWT